MSLKEKMRRDMAEAMRAGDTKRRDALRMLLAAVQQTEVDEQTTLDDAGVEAVLNKQAKQRRESIADYEQAGRHDMVEEEQAELAVIEGYLPEMMSREEVRQVASKTIVEMGATSPQDMGRVMGRLMAQLKGKADGRVVNEVVRELLQQ